ncbi:mediator of RNA polymerase-like protein II transcription subunit 6 [Lasiosphaeris hirsuta]|uniref:Mediator of RNA polymerase II transcription subunit 6 n=1 Tax=Lasiosphaeris hirsuta TaxID=260670 RepID=A0AA40AQ82_9PEZI|nr:mediator of RNA polymerase-like protein II transcription subunit 6 [Lasiosphaeris hirsuta]
MAFDPNAGPPLDEIQWRAPPNFEQGIHANSVLYYFAQSPFFDKTSNNEIVFQQGLNNPNMAQFLATRELFEGRLRSMSGLEFIVAQEPGESGPGAGTGVWVINKQTRRKRQGEDDEIVVHATYFIVGENIYMAPSLADIISARIATVSQTIAKILPIADGVQTWSPAMGRVYQTPTAQNAPLKDTRESTPMPEGLGKSSTAAASKTANSGLDSRLILQSLMIHDRYGGEYMDENPITGKPGEFHLSSTGRKEKLSVPKPGPLNLKDLPLPALNTKVVESPLAKSGKETKSPKTPSLQKPKRRKSKVTTTPS